MAKRQLSGAALETVNGEHYLKCNLSGKLLKQAYGLPSVNKDGSISRSMAFESPVAAISYVMRRNELDKAGAKDKALKAAEKAAKAPVADAASPASKPKRVKTEKEIIYDIDEATYKKLNLIAADLGLASYDKEKKEAYPILDAPGLKHRAAWGPTDAHPNVPAYMTQGTAGQCPYVSAASEAAIEAAKPKKSAVSKPLCVLYVMLPGEEKAHKFVISKDGDDELSVYDLGASLMTKCSAGKKSVLAISAASSAGQAANELANRTLTCDDSASDFHGLVAVISPGSEVSDIPEKGVEAEGQHEEKVSKKQAKKPKVEKPGCNLASLFDE